MKVILTADVKGQGKKKNQNFSKKAQPPGCTFGFPYFPSARTVRSPETVPAVILHSSEPLAA